jgi:hypothetical protein
MKDCPYCGYSNYDQATECRKCEASFTARGRVAVTKRHLVGPQKAHAIRHKALSFIVLGLFIKVYWGGYGPWPVIDNPILQELRFWFEPLFLYGGAAVYFVGWILNWI